MSVNLLPQAPQRYRHPTEMPLRKSMAYANAQNHSPTPRVDQLSRKLCTSLTLASKIPTLVTLCQKSLKSHYKTLQLIEIKNGNIYFMFKNSPMQCCTPLYEELNSSHFAKFDLAALQIIGGFCRSILRLNLSDIPVDDKTVAKFPLETVEVLNLSRTPISDAILEVLANRAKVLFNVTLNETKVTGLGVQKLSTLPSLRELRLENCAALTAEELWPFVSKCPTILKMNLLGCTKLHPCLSRPFDDPQNLPISLHTDITLETLAILLHTQREQKNLVIHNCLEGQLLERVFQAQTMTTRPPFASFIFKDFKLIDVALLQILQTHVPTLQSLGLIGGHVSSAGVSCIATTFTDLRCFVLMGTPESKVTDADLLSVSQRCQQLQELGLATLADLSPVGLMRIVENCKKLQTILITGCPKIAERDIQKIKEAYPNLKFG